MLLDGPTLLLLLLLLAVDTWIGTVPSLVVKVAKLVSSNDLWLSCVCSSSSMAALLERYTDDDNENRMIEMINLVDIDIDVILLHDFFDDWCCRLHFLFMLPPIGGAAFGGANPLFIVYDIIVTCCPIL